MFVVFTTPRSAFGVDGFSVTAHWSIIDLFPFGGFGEIWRHDIQGGDVVGHTKINDGPARAPTISADGKKVAVIRDDGMIAVLSIDGGTAEPLVQTHPHAFLDWPLGDWIYYTLGGFEETASSRYLRRVNAVTSVDEPVVTFDRGTWRFGISADLSRAAVRVNDEHVEPWGRIVAYDMLAGDGNLKLERSTDRFSCGVGMDPDGVYLIDGWNAHDGVDIRRWDSLEIASSFSHVDAAKWGGGAAGVVHNRNNWAANSQSWISMYLGWGLWVLPSGGNQVLYNWIDRERIVVTANAADSWTFDSSGDFWVTGVTAPSLPPSIQRQPQDRIVVAGRAARFTVSATSGPAPSYQWLRDGKLIEGATSWSYSLLSTTTEDDGSWYSCRVSNEAGAVTSSAARLKVIPAGTVVTNFPPTVEASFDTRSSPNRTLLLFGAATDDGQPDGVLTYQWSQVGGPKVELRTPDRDRTLVHFTERGEYTFHLTASDGDEQSSDEVKVFIVEPRSITLESPAGGEVWKAGTTQHIKWTTVGVEDVTIHYSIDDGQNWFSITPTIDTTSDDWGDYPWVVPNQPSTRCQIAITSYVDTSDSARSKPFEIKGEKIEVFTVPLQRPSPPASGCDLATARDFSDFSDLSTLWPVLLLLWPTVRKRLVLRCSF